MSTRFAAATRIAVFVMAGMCGVAVWVVAPLFVDQQDPWDMEAGWKFLYYPAALLVVGLLCGIVAPEEPDTACAGILVGQLCFMLAFKPSLGLLGTDLFVFLVFAPFAVIGLGVGRLLRSRFSAKSSSP